MPNTKPPSLGFLLDDRDVGPPPGHAGAVDHEAPGEQQVVHQTRTPAATPSSRTSCRSAAASGVPFAATGWVA